MAQPGTKSPPNTFPKSETGMTRLPEAAETKTISEETLDFVRGGVADLASANGPTAPTSRVYTRDYSKERPEPDDTDLISGALGMPPFRL